MRRKTVSVLFADVVGSTELGSKADPEVVQSAMSRYFDVARASVAKHGGTLEKFIGDAVMAVWGIPLAHEDDAVRAVRAAHDVRCGLAAIERELEDEYGVALKIRVGVNTGEVVVGDVNSGDPFATGDATNVAARLEQAAAPGELLIGPHTYRLVEHAVVAEPVDDLSLKGKAEKVPAWRVHEVVAAAPVRRTRRGSVFVGRRAELAVLDRALSEVATGEPRLVLIAGEPGAGKSRLVSEWLHRAPPNTRVVIGRCAAYGAAPLAPIAEALTSATAGEVGADPLERVTSLARESSDPPAAAAGLRFLVDATQPVVELEQTFWSIEEAFTALARRGPLRVAIDDLHWAEPLLLDLIDRLLDRSGGLLLLGTTRPDLYETRPDIRELPRVREIVLEPLEEADTASLLEDLAGREAPPADLVTYVAGIAQGNPLFIEEVFSSLVEEGLVSVDPEWNISGPLEAPSMPLTLDALLTARIDRLPEDERTVMQVASVIGRSFDETSLTALRGEPAADVVVTLIDKGMFESEGGRAGSYRFHHVLIRDASYRMLSKRDRGALHEQYARLLQGEPSPNDAAIGYHLETAYGYRVEVGPRPEPTLAREAALHLGRAARLAALAGNITGAIELFSRAVALLEPGDPARTSLLPPLGQAMGDAGELERAAEVLEEAVSFASAAGDVSTEGMARFALLDVLAYTHPEEAVAQLEPTAAELIPRLEAAGDHAGLARAWRARMFDHLVACDGGGLITAIEKALHYAERSGDEAILRDVLFWYIHALLTGSLPAGEGVRRIEELAGRAGDDRKLNGMALVESAGLLGMLGRFDEAVDRLDRGSRILQELGMPLLLSAQVHASGVPVMIFEPSGRVELAVKDLRGALEEFEKVGDRAYLPTIAAWLGELSFDAGDYDEAARYVQITDETAARDDLFSMYKLYVLRARLAAQAGDEASTIANVDAASEILRPMDFPYYEGRAEMHLADALIRIDRTDEARSRVTRAVSLFEAKEALAPAQAARTTLARLNL